MVKFKFLLSAAVNAVAINNNTTAKVGVRKRFINGDFKVDITLIW
jgi:hypothetical protein